MLSPQERQHEGTLLPSRDGWALDACCPSLLKPAAWKRQQAGRRWHAANTHMHRGSHAVRQLGCTVQAQTLAQQLPHIVV